MPNSPAGLARRIGLAAVLICLALPLPARAAQEETASPEADSIALLEEAKQVQKEFERFREQRLPPEWSGFGGQCDALVGRMCLRHGDGEAPPVEPAPLEVEMARMDMLRTLGRIHSSVPRDRWVLGQRVYYLREQGELLRAEALTERCHPDDEWWCMALKGYLLQSLGESIDAEAVFRDAIPRMPEEERERWLALDYLLDEEARELFEDADPAEQAALRQRLWLLADPLYLVEGNDREAEQYARQHADPHPRVGGEPLRHSLGGGPGGACRQVRGRGGLGARPAGAARFGHAAGQPFHHRAPPAPRARVHACGGVP